MTQTQKRVLGGIGFVVVIGSLITLAFLFFAKKGPPIVCLGGSIDVYTLGEIYWQPHGNGFITSTGVDTSVIKTQGTFLPNNIPPNTKLSSDWSVTITTTRYPRNGTTEWHEGQITIGPAGGRVQISSPEGFSDAPLLSGRPHGKSFFDSTCFHGQCHFHMLKVDINLGGGNSTPQTLFCHDFKCEIDIGPDHTYFAR
jgi:hypothetical protein